MTIRERITSLVFVLLILTVVAIIFALNEIGKAGETLSRIVYRDIALTDEVKIIFENKLSQQVNFERALRFASQSITKDDSFKIPFRESEEEFKRSGELIKKSFAAGDRLLSGSSTFITDRRIKAEHEKLRKMLLYALRVYLDYEEHGKIILELLAQNSTREANIETLSITGKAEELQISLDNFAEAIEIITRNSTERAMKDQELARRWVVLILVISVFVGLLLAYFITRSITVPLGEAVSIAERVAKGDKDIDIAISHEGEVGQLLVALKNMLEAVNDSEKQLKIRAEELANSNAELEQFAYVASHDLQEPLRMVASFTQLLQKRYQGQLDKDADEFIGFAVDGVRRMKQLINDLLQYSRVGRDNEQYKEIDLSLVLQDALSNLQALIEESRAQIVYNDLPCVYCMPSQISRVFQNLISNAIKFQDNNIPEIEINVIEETTFWKVSIKDNGIGLDFHFSERIFNIFQRLHAMDEYSGTGIGLAICKKIIERHDGVIWVESNLGIGATFFFTLPKRS